MNGTVKNIGVGRSLSMLCLAQKIIYSYYRSSKFLYVFINYNILLDNPRLFSSLRCVKPY